jgi:hypothetical protein
VDYDEFQAEEEEADKTAVKQRITATAADASAATARRTDLGEDAELVHEEEEDVEENAYEDEFMPVEYDEDEFEGFAELNAERKVASSLPESERFVRSQEEVPKSDDDKREDALANFKGVRSIAELEFRIEGLFVIASLLYLVNVIVGRFVPCFA